MTGGSTTHRAAVRPVHVGSLVKPIAVLQAEQAHFICIRSLMETIGIAWLRVDCVLRAGLLGKDLRLTMLACEHGQTRQAAELDQCGLVLRLLVLPVARVHSRAAWARAGQLARETPAALRAAGFAPAPARNRRIPQKTLDQFWATLAEQDSIRSAASAAGFSKATGQFLLKENWGFTDPRILKLANRPFGGRAGTDEMPRKGLLAGPLAFEASAPLAAPLKPAKPGA